MAPVIVFPDATAITINYLNDELPSLGWDVPVVQDVPDPRPAQFVTVRRGGGPRLNLVTDTAQLLFECWADRSEDAYDLARDVRGLVDAMARTVQGGVPIYRVDEPGGPGLLPDQLSAQPRWVFMKLVHLRGSTPESS